MINWKKEFITWLTSGSDKSEDPIDLVWTVKEKNGYIIAEHPKVPFVLYITIDEKFARLSVHTDLTTALLDPIRRLDITRKLLFLNDRVDLIKYVIKGINEEIVLKSELDLNSLSKIEFDDALTALLTGLFMMIKEFKLEEQFNKKLYERVIYMIKERMDKGATKENLIKFLIKKLGLSKDNAEKLINEIIHSSRTLSKLKPEDMVAYQ